MSSESDSAEKTHEPTQRKLDEARRKGDIPRSTDLVTAGAYGGFLVAALSAGPAALLGMGEVLQVPIERAAALSDVVFADDRGQALLGGFGGRVVLAGAPWFLGPAAVAVLVLVAQRGVVFAPSKLRPKLDRVSPLATFKRKFGRAGLFEFVKSFAKLLLYSAVLFWYLLGQLPRLVATAALSPAQATVEMLRMAVGLMMIVLGVALALGFVDLLFQRAEHARKQRMSRKELTDEMKETEGDPHMKSERRQKGVEIATNRMLADVATADVVIVNPSHYAVALGWDRGSGRAPVCVAKGVDEIARRIREAAEEARVPVRRDPPTARALHATVEIGAEIQRGHYRAVAAAIRFAERARAAMRRHG